MDSKKGLKVNRFFSKDIVDPYQASEWKFIDVKIKDHNTGKSIYELSGVEVPSSFSHTAEQTMVSKYFRMTDVPVETTAVDEVNINGESVPKWLRRSVPSQNSPFTHETSVRQVIHRMAGFWAYWGWMKGYFQTEEDAKNFYDESVVLLLTQRAAPNTPQWFNAGLNWAYGIEGPDRGYWKAESDASGILKSWRTRDQYTHPGLHACYIFSVSDEMFGTENQPGIYKHLCNETRAFITGGGSGANYSHIRAKNEKISTGAAATGLKSFCKVLDSSAGIIKSGSSSRRAAKMLVINLDHPEIEDIVNWKAEEEKKVEALINAGYDNHFEGPAYQTVSGQNANISVRIPTSFLHSVDADGTWELTARTNGQVVKTVNAKDLWGTICKATLESGDPGVQYEDIISDWDTCPNDEPIEASNPCSEFLFKNDTACNLASLNVQKFFDETGKRFFIEEWCAATRHFAIVLDISIEAAQLPTKLLAEGTVKYRSIGLGHTGIAAVFMRAGMPYDSDKACNLAAAITSLMTSEAYVMSAELARTMGTFPRFKDNKDGMLDVLKNHSLAASGNPKSQEYGSLSIKPYEISHKNLPKGLSEAIVASWDSAIKNGQKSGFRNAFVTLIQPSGTVGLIMDCDTTAVEPDYAIVKNKFLSGGGVMKIVNKSIEQALINLKYTKQEIDDIMAYVLGRNTLDGAPHISKSLLLEAGIIEEDIDNIESSLMSQSDLRNIFMNLSKKSVQSLGIKCSYTNGKPDLSNVNVFKYLDIGREQYIEASKWICGNGSFEGAPHLKDGHSQIFLTAGKSGWGEEYLPISAKLNMVAAVQPFISGGISCTFNLPKGATTEDISYAFRTAHDLGVKCIAIYVDGSKKFQPLTNLSSMEWWDDDVEMTPALVRGQRKKPSHTQDGFKTNVTIHGSDRSWKLWIHFYEYPDGEPCEVWVDISEENPHIQKCLEWWGRAVSNAIQYGQPIEELASSYLLSTGGPNGQTDNPYVTFCTSIPDLVFKLMLMHYRGETQWCKNKPKANELRMNIIRSGKGNVGSVQTIKKSEEALAVVFKSQHNPLKCPKCGSSSINPYPCAFCESCGHSLGGCSP